MNSSGINLALKFTIIFEEGTTAFTSGAIMNLTAADHMR
jgi:hypothetical protein